MIYKRQTKPNGNVISVAQVKETLRGAPDQDDSYIARLISSVEASFEKYTGLSLLEQQWSVKTNRVQDLQTNQLLYGPVISLDSITITEDDGSTTAVDLDEFYVIQMTNGFCISRRRYYFDDIWSYGHPSRQYPVETLLTTGFGEAEDVPADIVDSLIEFVCHRYDEPNDSGSIPPHVKQVWSGYRDNIV